jgi:hypothetical protein
LTLLARVAFVAFCRQSHHAIILTKGVSRGGAPFEVSSRTKKERD